MKTITTSTSANCSTGPERNGTTTIPLLESGDRLTQAEFHRRYEAYPTDKKFELIGGMVHMPSPLRYPHGLYQAKLVGAVDHYCTWTHGVEAADNATTILGEESEPQPDVTLRVISACGGRSKINEDQYVEGPPEWLGEIAHSTVAIDLHDKKVDYQRAGVLEYVVVCIAEEEIHWFNFKTGRPIKPDRQGIYRSRVLPGLWLNGPALMALDSVHVLKTLQQGLDSPEHQRFVKHLEGRRKRLR